MKEIDPKKTEGASGPEGGGNVDKIRDILFGTQMRTYDKRLSRLEERHIKETSDLREDLKKRLASLETYVKGEVEAWNERLKAEKAERGEGLKELARELRDGVKTLDKKLGHLEDVASKGQRESRQALLEQSKRLAQDLEQRWEELSNSLTGEIDQVRTGATDRLALADLLAEMSLRLKNEWKEQARD